MFIVWGKRRKEKTIGSVADFCPMCRDLRGFYVRAVKMVSHLYFIPLSSQTVGHMVVCAKCGYEHPANLTEYESVANDPGPDFDSLIEKTYPSIREDWLERLALEKVVAESPQRVPPDQREDLIREVFLYCAPTVEKIHGDEIQLDRASGWGCFTTLGLTVLLLVVYLMIKERKIRSDSILPAIGIVLGISMVVTVYLIATVKRRQLRQKILPLLGRALAPLQPDVTELHGVLDEFSHLDMKIGKKLKPETVQEAINHFRYTDSAN